MIIPLRRALSKLLSENAYRRGRPAPRVGPRYAQIEPTVRCNLRCRMCARTLEPEAYTAPDMTREQFLALLAQMPALETLQFNGFGEPFLNPELPEMIADAAARGIRVLVNSNATLWTPDLARRTIESGVETVKISLESAVSEEFRAIRGVDLERVLEGTRNLVAARAKAGGTEARRPRLSLNVTVQADNALHLDRLFPLAASLAVDDLRFKSMLAFDSDALRRMRAAVTEDLTGSADAEGDRGDRAPKRTLREALEAAIAAARVSGMASNIEAFAREVLRETRAGAEEDPRDAKDTKDGEGAEGASDETKGEGSAGARAGAVKNRGAVPRCHVPWLEVFIAADGMVRPCCKFYKPGMMDLGNALERPLDEIWRSQAYRSLRARFVAERPIHPVCLDCDKHGQSRRLLKRVRRRYRFLPL